MEMQTSLSLSRIAGGLDIIEPQIQRLASEYRNQIEDIKAFCGEKLMEPESVEVIEPCEIEAVKRGEIEGEHYESDDETWAVVESLEAWRQLAQKHG